MALTRPTLAQLTTGIARISDPITVLHQGATSANVDVGFLFNRANGLVSNVALYWSEATQSIITAYTDNSGQSDSNISVTSYAPLTVGNLLMVNGSIIGVTGNVTVGNLVANTGIYATSFNFANGLPFISSTYSNANVTAYLPTDSTITAIQANVTAANAAIVTANSAVVSYVNSLNSSMIGNVNAANSAIVTANTSMKGYVDAITTAWTSNAGSQQTQINTLQTQVYSNANVIAYLPTYSGSIGTVVSTSGDFTVGGNLVVNGSTNTINNTIYETTEYVVTQYATSVYAATLGNIGSNIIGTGTYITGINASNLSSGTVPNARLSGAYTGVTGLGTLSSSVTISNNQAASSTTTGALVVTGGVGISGALYITSTGDVSANIGGYQIWANANVSGLYNSILGANAAIVTANTAMKGYVDAVTTAWTSNAGSQQTQINTLQTQVYANSNVAAYLTSGNISVGGNLTIGSTNGNSIVATGNVWQGNVFATGLYWAGNGAVISTGGGGGGTGITYTASTTAPISPNVGDQWYYTTGDILYEYQNVGTGSFWIDITSAVISSGTVTVPGGDAFSPFLLMGA